MSCLNISLLSGLVFYILSVAPTVIASGNSADDFLIVHCLLPGQLRQLGRQTTYVSARRPTRTTAQECRQRGGEYVRQDQASAGAALQVWSQKAQGGDPTAQTTLGEIFEKGVNGVPDYAAAAKWYQLAANQGAVRAQINLGHLFEQGLGVSQNSKTALAWYRKASGLTASAELDPGADIAPVIAAQEQEILALKAQLNTRLQEQEKEQRAGERRDQQTQSTIDKLQQQLGELNEELFTAREAAAQANLTKPPAPTTAPTGFGELVGPTITLVDPMLGHATRGLVKITANEGAQSSELPTLAGPADQLLIGRVQAPAGLLQLTINNQPLPTNSAGVFQTRVPQPENQSKQTITLTAIDQQAKRTDLRFEIRYPATSAPIEASPKPKPLLQRKRAGNYHALLIGNNAYQNLPDLETPLNDVTRLESILRKRYGFKVDVLRNATRFDILAKLNELRAQLTTNDNLLLYYAGHGELDKKNRRGHWLPVDASPASTANWISNVDVTDILNVMQARQVMLVVDSCYSGTLTRSSLSRLNTAMTDEERRTWLELMVSKRSRVVLASGGLAPVLDIGGGRHSVFAKALLDAMDANQDILPGRALHEAVAARVAHVASSYEFEQLPEYAPISRAGHEAGDFLLLPNDS